MSNRYRVRWQCQDNDGQWLDCSYETDASTANEAAFLAGVSTNGFVSRPRRNMKVYKL